MTEKTEESHRLFARLLDVLSADSKSHLLPLDCHHHHCVDSLRPIYLFVNDLGKALNLRSPRVLSKGNKPDREGLRRVLSKNRVIGGRSRQLSTLPQVNQSERLFI